jgi:NADPH-dependent 2,4-dienoyl-CoA reductase/sulfur reductase-like enzyme
MPADRDVDVLVVGSGAAGLAAALSARENGAQSVLIAESEGLGGLVAAVRRTDDGR